MSFKLRNRHFFLLDVFLLAAAPFIALSLRVNLPWAPNYLSGLLIYAPMALVIKLPILYAFGLYRRFWPFASIDTMISIIMGVGLASGIVVVSFFAMGTLGLPRSIPIIDGMLTLIFVGGTRFSVRLLNQILRRGQKNGLTTHRLLIAGAGEAGQLVAREVLSSRYITGDLVGFVDDDPQKISARIHGVKVLGSLEDIPDILHLYQVDEVIIAMPSVPGEVIRKVIASTETAGVATRTLPGIYELLSGEVSISRLREVEINDLLRRQPVKIDPSQVVELLGGKKVLVTGAGGSIGVELCLQIAGCNPGELIVLGHGENSLHTLQSRFTKAGYPKEIINIVVADIRDEPRIDTIFQRHQPDVIFHAAAHKHVPLMEANLEDAVTNNIIGTWNLVQAAKKHEISKFVLISTDKAVQPVNVMGMTKRVAELIVRQAALETSRPYVSVRFGNVLDSRGSVIPIFKRQIAAGGPVTVTHPEVERYFMTIPEAVQLVLQASALGKNGEVFVLDMGKPIKIKELAADMIELSGYQIGEDIQIEYTGLRPGERLKEALFNPNEHSSQTQHKKIFVAQNGMSPTLGKLGHEINILEALARSGQKDKLREKLEQVSNELG
jgi:FlaA1/EpsC-like NDP-sugar epimerase